MATPILIDRRPAELALLRRRRFLQAAAAWTAGGGAAGALAQARGNIVEMAGAVRLNGRPLQPGETVQTGDRIDTGEDGHLVVVIGGTACLVRARTRLVVERGSALNLVGALRLLSGAVATAWRPGPERRVITPTLTAGIRGTGVYVEVFPDRWDRTYLCNCWGEVALAAGDDRLTSVSRYHQSFWAEPAPVDGRRLRPAGAINHTDEEMEYLAGLVDTRTAWQVAGRKGLKDGRGLLDEAPAGAAPAAPAAPAPR